MLIIVKKNSSFIKAVLRRACESSSTWTLVHQSSETLHLDSGSVWFSSFKTKFLFWTSFFIRLSHHNKSWLVSVYSLWQDSQYVSDSPLLIVAILDGQLEGELRLSAFHQLKTTLWLDVLDRATLSGERERAHIDLHYTRKNAQRDG